MKIYYVGDRQQSLGAKVGSSAPSEFGLVDLTDGRHTTEEVIRTFQEYAGSGAAIALDTVKNILQTHDFTQEDLRSALAHMRHGEKLHRNHHEVRQADEYAFAADYIG